MEMFDLFCLNIAIICFLITIYTILITFKSNFKKGEKKAYIEITLYVILFILIYFLRKYNIRGLSFSLLIPLLISQYKSKKITSITISLIILYYLVNELDYNIYFTLSYFILIEIIHYIYINSSLKIYSYIIIFTIISSIYIILINYNLNIIYMLKIILLFILSVFIIMYLLVKLNRLLYTFKTLSDYKKEDKIRLTISKISHEVKNPLTVIKGYLEVLDNKSIVEDKNKILNEINYALNIINDFKDINHLIINKKEFIINNTINSIIKDVIPFFTNKKVIINFKPKKDYYIYADEKRIKQALINIIKNAIEATKENDKIIIISINLTKRKNNIIITIKDKGKGMTKEEIDKLFLPFYTKKENGTGLGLCLSKEIIDKHKGTISYFSKKNEYTTVTIVLPNNKDNIHQDNKS